MNKNLLILTTLAAALASCSSDDLLVDENSSTSNGVEIAFDTYTQKQTRATENNDKDYAWSLKDHHETFDVWSTKQVGSNFIAVHGSGATNDPGIKVNWNTSTSKWVPVTHKYWDKAATKYLFYAAAPDDAKWKITNRTSTSNYSDAYLTYSEFILAGTNIADATYSKTLNNSWKDKGGDVDLMIAAPNTVSNISSITSSNQTVTLDFIHILSRLNVAFKKSTALDAATVKVTDFKVCNLVNKGDFNEGLHAATATTPGANDRWAPSTVATDIVTIQGVHTDAALSSSEAYYTVQSLVIPQNVAYEALARDGSTKAATSKPYISVKYTIDNEPYVAYINLADAFGKVKYTAKTDLTVGTSDVSAYYTQSGTSPNYVYTPAVGVAKTGVTYYEKAADGVLAFNEGWQNNLTITLDALEILFDATVSEWADGQTAEYTIK